jgi:hypothetical protein
MESVENPMNKPIFNPLNEVIARHGNREAEMMGD